MKGMYIPPVGWLETLLYGRVDDFTDMMTPRATGDDAHQYGSTWADRSQERVDEMIEQHGSREEVLDRIEQGRIGFSSDWKDDVLHYLNNPGGGSSSSGQGANDDAGGGPSSSDQGANDDAGGGSSSSGQGADDDEGYSGGGSQSSEPQDRDDSPPDPPSRYRDDDDDGYSRRRTVSPPAVEPEPLLSAFATGEEGYAPEAIGALDTEERGGALGDGEERVSLQGMEDERRAVLAQERDSERQQASKEQQEGGRRGDYLYDALWYSESTDELTEEQLELLYAQLSGLRETGVSGDEMYQAIGQSEVVSGMSEEQRDTLLRDVGTAQSSSAAAQDVEVGSFGTGSEIGPYVPEPGDLIGRGPESGGIEQAEDLLGEYDKGTGVERGGLDPFDAGPHVPNPENLLDRWGSGRDIETGLARLQAGGAPRTTASTGDTGEERDEPTTPTTPTTPTPNLEQETPPELEGIRREALRLHDYWREQRRERDGVTEEEQQQQLNEAIRSAVGWIKLRQSDESSPYYSPGQELTLDTLTASTANRLGNVDGYWAGVRAGRNPYKVEVARALQSGLHGEELAALAADYTESDMGGDVLRKYKSLRQRADALNAEEPEEPGGARSYNARDWTYQGDQRVWIFDPADGAPDRPPATLPKGVEPDGQWTYHEGREYWYYETPEASVEPAAAGPGPEFAGPSPSPSAEQGTAPPSNPFAVGTAPMSHPSADDTGPLSNPFAVGTGPLSHPFTPITGGVTPQQPQPREERYAHLNTGGQPQPQESVAKSEPGSEPDVATERAVSDDIPAGILELARASGIDMDGIRVHHPGEGSGWGAIRNVYLTADGKVLGHGGGGGYAARVGTINEAVVPLVRELEGVRIFRPQPGSGWGGITVAYLDADGTILATENEDGDAHAREAGREAVAKSLGFETLPGLSVARSPVTSPPAGSVAAPSEYNARDWSHVGDSNVWIFDPDGAAPDRPPTALPQGANPGGQWTYHADRDYWYYEPPAGDAPVQPLSGQPAEAAGQPVPEGQALPPTTASSGSGADQSAEIARLAQAWWADGVPYEEIETRLAQRGLVPTPPTSEQRVGVTTAAQALADATAEAQSQMAYLNSMDDDDQSQSDRDAYESAQRVVAGRTLDLARAYIAAGQPVPNMYYRGGIASAYGHSVNLRGVTSEEELSRRIGEYRQLGSDLEEADNEGPGGGGEAQAAIQRGLQELRNKGASVEELEAAGSALHSVVGDGSSDQQQQNIAKIKELTRGQVHTDTGGRVRSDRSERDCHHRD